MMMRNILKNTRNTTFEAKAMGTMPSSVVVAPTNTDGPISPIALAIRKSVETRGSWPIRGEHHVEQGLANSLDLLAVMIECASSTYVFCAARMQLVVYI